MLIALLALSTPLPAQEPVGGWHRPIWSIDSEAGQPLEVTPLVDFNGDGIDDAFVKHGTRGELVSGATGLPLIVQQIPLGSAVAYAEDLNGDGAPDLIVGEPNYMEAMTVVTGRITAWSGATLQPLWRRVGEDGDRLGENVEFVDADGDGLPDLRAQRSAAATTRAMTLRGVDGLPLWSIRNSGFDFGGWIPDLNGDGVEDFLLGRANHLACLDGHTGAQLWTNAQYVSGSNKWSSAFVAELNGQPGLELCLGIRDFQQSGSGERGAIQVFDVATGLRLWEVRAWVTYTDLAEQLHLVDADGDGDQEVLSASRTQIVQLDGGTGSELWQREVTSSHLVDGIYSGDQDADGVLDIVVHRRGFPGSLQAYGGVDGQTLWRYDGRTQDEQFEQVIQEDLNLDGTPDYLAASPEASGLIHRGGSVRVINGATGTVLWARGGALRETRLGLRAMLAELDGQAGIDVVLLGAPDTGINPETGYLGVHGASGMRLWGIQIEPRNRLDEVWTPVDLEGDGSEDLLILGSLFDLSLSRSMLLSGEDGIPTWEHRVNSTGLASGLSWVATLSDADGDQLNDLLWLRRTPDGRSILELVSGADLDWQAGMSASQNQVSVAQGGTLQLQLAMPPASARHFYQVLASITGSGPSEVIGLQVPLSQDVALTRTLSGLDFGILRPQIGRLDAASQATVDFVLAPGQFGAGLVGRTLYLAAITQPTPSVAPERSTQAVAIQLLP